MADLLYMSKTTQEIFFIDGEEVPIIETGV